MDDRAELLKRVDRMIQRLSSPLLPSHVADGWSEEARTAMLKVFMKLHAKLMSAEPLSEMTKHLTIARGMDTWGVTGGDLLKEGAEISCMLTEAK